MRRVGSIASLTAVALFVLVGSVQAQHSRPFTTTMSGTGAIPLGRELNGHPLSLSLCGGKSNLPGGSFECNTTGYSVLEPPEDYGFDTARCPGGVEIEVLEHVANHVNRFSTGDVLYTVPDPDQDEYFCVYDTYVTSVSHWLIVGGSGPYEGATGASVFYGVADILPLGDPLGENYLMYGFPPGRVEGTITFAK